jgi:hypothetical protein
MSIRSIALVLLLLAPAAWAQPDAAKKLFEQYVALGQAFDESVADLYAEAALIRNKRTYPNGEVRELTMPAPKYKALIRQVMPLAKSRGDRSTYSAATYAVEGDRVRIHASRFSEMRNYTSPVSLLVGPGPDGRWLIFEELTESRPQ